MQLDLVDCGRDGSMREERREDGDREVRSSD